MDEQIQDVKQAVQTGIQVGKAILDYLKKREEALQNKELKLIGSEDFGFSGQITDLSYFSDNKYMPISAIEKIEDAELRNAVKDSFTKAQKKGLITIDNQKGIISITDKGTAYIKKPKFQEVMQKFQKSPLQKQLEMYDMFGVELTGTPNDLNVFNFQQEINIDEILRNPNQEAVKKIMDNFIKLQQDGMIILKENNMLSLTERGKAFINNPIFKSSTSGLAEKAIESLGGVAGKVLVITKKILKTAVQTAVTSVSPTKTQ